MTAYNLASRSGRATACGVNGWAPIDIPAERKRIEVQRAGAGLGVWMTTVHT
jgi:hypothetical protein